MEPVYSGTVFALPDFVAEELKQRLAVPGKLDPHADPTIEPASDALAGPLQGPKLARLHILPFGQQIPSPFLFVSLRPRQRRLPPLEGTQFFDSAPEANELLAVDATLLKIPKLLLVLGLHRGPTRLEPFADTAHSFHRPVQHGFQPVPHVFKVDPSAFFAGGEYPAARPLQLLAQLVLAGARGIVSLHEALQEPSQLLRARSQF